MKIAVCVKSVPDPEYYDSIHLDPVNKTLVREGIPSIINIADKHAIEEALRIKERLGGEITVISMGPPNAKTQMLEALAMGADKAYLISDRKVGGADTLATSYTLFKAIEKTGPYDLVLAGNESADGATSHVPSQLGEWMKVPHVANVCKIDEGEDCFVVLRQFESGCGKYRVKMPCVIAVNQYINQVRLTNAMAIIRAKRKPLTILTADDFDELDENFIGLSGSPSQNGEMESIESCKECIMIGAEDETEASEKVYAILAGELGLMGGK